MCARMHACMFTYLHMSVKLAPVCVSVHVHVCVRDDGRAVTRPGGGSHPIVGGEHEARHLFFPKMNYETKPSVCYSPHH